MLPQLTALAIFALHFTSASPLHDDHAPIHKRLPGDTWYHDSDHPAHALFRRQSSNPTDGGNYAAVGSSGWYNAYPPAAADTTKLPQAWVNALNAAVSAGKIPNIPPSTSNPSVNGGNPTYPNGLDPTGKEVCSGTYKCRIDGDVWDAPQGTLGCGFDDGPLPSSDKLYQFLQANNQRTTHFFIGVNILNNPNEFKTAYNNQDDIAVHTWTHPYMTTQSNLQVLAELGWSMELIHNSTGGRLPRYWRPPYGDTDTRVYAIAKEVFGLTTILWNQDTEDWSLTSGGTTAQKINSSMTQWLTGSKSPGLIILEHELSDQSVAAFIAAYPVMKQNNWNITSVAQLANAGPAWQNSAGYGSSVQPATDILVGSFQSATSSASSAPAGTTASQSTEKGSAPSSSASSASGSSSGSSKTSSASDLHISTISSLSAFALIAMASIFCLI